MSQGPAHEEDETMITIGVTGGVGAGKSEVLRYLNARWGAEILRLDDLGRTLLDPDGACYHDAVRLLGEEIVLPDGTLDRKRIAAMIFSDGALREGLNALIHPAVRETSLNMVRGARERDVTLMVIESALLFDDHYDAICDEVWYIYADAATRSGRLKASRGYPEERIRGIMKAQLSDEAFRARCAAVIDNSGSFESTERQIDTRIREMLS